MIFTSILKFTISIQHSLGRALSYFSTFFFTTKEYIAPRYVLVYDYKKRIKSQYEQTSGESYTTTKEVETLSSLDGEKPDCLVTDVKQFTSFIVHTTFFMQLISPGRLLFTFCFFSLELDARYGTEQQTVYSCYSRLQKKKKNI